MGGMLLAVEPLLPCTDGLSLSALSLMWPLTLSALACESCLDVHTLPLLCTANPIRQFHIPLSRSNAAGTAQRRRGGHWRPSKWLAGLSNWRQRKRRQERAPPHPLPTQQHSGFPGCLAGPSAHGGSETGNCPALHCPLESCRQHHVLNSLFGMGYQSYPPAVFKCSMFCTERPPTGNNCTQEASQSPQ